MAFDWRRERRWLASLGVAMAAAGFVRYTTQNELTTLSKGLLIGGGIYYWLLTRNVESTDDAYTDGRAVTIAPQVSGLVVSLDVPGFFKQVMAGEKAEYLRHRARLGCMQVLSKVGAFPSEDHRASDTDGLRGTFSQGGQTDVHRRDTGDAGAGRTASQAAQRSDRSGVCEPTAANGAARCQLPAL